MIDFAFKDVSDTALRRRWSRQKLRLRHILVPLDFSGQSREALTYAVPLARAEGARISLVHVVQNAAVVGALPDGSTFIPPNVEELTVQAETRLRALATRLLPASVRGKTFVRQGEPGFEIVATAEKMRADLIALSTHGYTGFARVLLGSTARSVVRHAHCPVLTIRRHPATTAKRSRSRAKPTYRARPPWGRILVPVDFSLTSLRALNVAVPLARATGAHCDLLHVIEPEVYAAGMDGAMLAVPVPASVEAAQSELARVRQQFLPASVEASLLVAQGQAATVIVETARKRGADLIVLSTHGRTGLKRMLLGSTAEEVVVHANCPVFVTRRLARTAAARTERPITHKQKRERKSHGNRNQV
jgi:nucleotide-binding universal stress UspA family protein